MKLRRTIILFLAALLIGLSLPAFAQGVIGDDSSLSFHGVSAQQAVRELLPLEQTNIKEDLEILRRLRDQLAAVNSGAALIEIDRSRLKDASINKGASSTFIVGKELTPQPIPFQQHETSAPREVGASVV
jgi:hypothetical protein